MRKHLLAGLLTAALLAAPAQAGDANFTPDAAATWSARTMRMAHIVDPANLQELTKDDFKFACDGLTGEQMKHEYGKVPRWALSSQINICSAYAGWRGSLMGSKSMCKTLESGLKDLDKAMPGIAPDEVVSAAQAMHKTGDLILQSAQQHKACKR